MPQTQVDEIKMLDIRAAESVEVSLSDDQNTLWVNVDGLCRLRVSSLSKVSLTLPTQR